MSNAVSITPTLRTSSRRAVFWVATGFGALIIALVTMLINGTMTSGGTVLGVDNPKPAGAMAVAEVLAQQGVDVIKADTLETALDATAAAQAADAGVTLFVADLNGFLNSSQVAQLAGIAPDTVIVAPDFTMLQKLAPEVGFGGVSESGVPLTAASACSDAAAHRAGAVAGLDGNGLSTLSIPTDAAGYSGCFAASDSGDSARSYLLVQSETDQRHLSLVADSAIFANASITEEGNAALALGLLGEHPTLVWYQPTVADVETSGQPTLAELSPGWVTPVMLLLLLAGITASVAYGRRFGALVVENLPVTVRASETMEGRARLYSCNSTRLHAVDALRMGTVSRLAGKLGLASTTSVDDVVAAAASVIAQDPRIVREILLTERPASDADMLRLSDRLLDLERTVDNALNPGGTRPTTSNERMEP